MNAKQKGILINGIINKLNEHLREENKRLCEQNLFSMQKPLHGGDMFFTLAFMSDEAIQKIAAACGL